jgi:hypothetical protein
MRTLSKRYSLRTVWTSRNGNKAKKALLVPLSLALAVAASNAHAADRDFKWEELQKQGRVSAGTVLPPESGSSGHTLRIENSKPDSLSVTVLTIDQPQLIGLRYMLRGQVRYDNVEGTGYLEMWSHFPGGGQYFSRTLAEEGPMMKLNGTSGWRAFVLPFDASGAPPPTRLVVNVVFQGRGTVFLGPLALSDEKGSTTGQQENFRTNRLASIAGGVVGCIGALIGVFTSLGRARRFVIASAQSLIVFGALAFIAGIVAFESRSYSSLYPFLLLVGFLASVVPLGLLPVIRKRYEEIELRTMRAHDIG